jgi:hypothetical protein
VLVEEYQPLELMEEEATKKALEDGELIEFSQWEGLAVQLRDSYIECGHVLTPPTTPH